MVILNKITNKKVDKHGTGIYLHYLKFANCKNLIRSRHLGPSPADSHRNAGGNLKPRTGSFYSLEEN